MEFSRPEYWSGLLCPLPGDLPNPGIEPRSPTLQADFLPSEPPGKAKNSGVGSLSLLQGIFPTQELNHGLLHCRQIFLPADPWGKPASQSKFPLPTYFTYDNVHVSKLLYLSHPLLPSLCNSGVFIIPFYLLCWLLAITLCLIVIVALGLRVYLFKLSESTCNWYYVTLNRV